jgi:hypothetical protein
MGQLPRLVVVAAALALMGGVPRVAAQQGTACNFAADFTISPGLSSEPSSGTVSTGGETGTMECQGTVNGKRATGPGTFGADGRYGTQGADTCASGGEGDAHQSFTVPTEGGSEHVDNDVTFTYGALSGGAVVGGEFKSDRFSGTFEITPTEGDCVTAPVTRVHFTARGTLRD